MSDKPNEGSNEPVSGGRRRAETKGSATLERPVPPTRPRSNDITGGTPPFKRETPKVEPSKVEIDPKALDWVKQLVGAKDQSEKSQQQQDKRSKTLIDAKSGLTPENLKGLDFKIDTKEDFSTREKLMLLLKRQTKLLKDPKNMKSLTGSGDALGEIDSVHDTKDLKSIDPATLKAAGESLRHVIEADQKVDSELMALYAEEFGIKPEQFETLSKALNKKRADAKDPLRNSREKLGLTVDGEGEEPEQLADFEKLRQKVEKEVRDEVWQPLVRQGLLPENFVPDQHSEVARTFEGANEAYTKRIEEYTKTVDEKSEKAKQLTALSSGISTTLDGVKGVLALAPGGEVLQYVNEGIDAVKVLQSGAFELAGAVITGADAQGIGEIVAKTISATLKQISQIPPEIASCVDSGLSVVLSGGKVIKGLQSGKPNDIAAALADAVSGSLSIAGSFTDIPDLASIQKYTAQAITTSGKVAVLGKAFAIKDPEERKKAIKAALVDLAKDAISALASATKDLVDQNVGGDKRTQIDGLVDSGATLATALVDWAGGSGGAEDAANAAAGVVSQLLGTAGVPSDVQKYVDQGLKVALSSGQDVVKGIIAGDPKAVAAALADGLTQSLSFAASQGVDIPNLDLVQAAATKAITAGGGIAVLIKAMSSGDQKAVAKALQELLKNGISALASIGKTLVSDNVQGQKGGQIGDVIDGTEALLESAIDWAAGDGDAQAVAEQVGALTGTILAAADVPNTVQAAVSGAIGTGLKVGAAIYAGVKDGNARAVTDALAQAVADALATANKSGAAIPDLDTVTSAVVGGIKGASAAAALAKAFKAKDKDAIADALSALIGAAGEVIGTTLEQASDDGKDAPETTGTKSGMTPVAKAALSNSKGAALFKALAKISDDAAVAYLADDVGPTVGGGFRAAFKKSAPLSQAVDAGEPAEFVVALASLLAKALKLGAQGVGGSDKETAAALTLAAKTVKQTLKTLPAAKKLEQAVAAGDARKIKTAYKLVANAVMESVMAGLDGTLADPGGTDDEDITGLTLPRPGEEDDDDDAPALAGDSGAVEGATKSAAERLQDEEDRLTTAIAESKKQLLDQTLSPARRKELEATRDKAVKELAEQKMMQQEVEEDAAAFAKMLETSADGGDGDTTTLETLIAQIQKDQQILALVDSMTSMGIGVAAHFFPPMGAALDFKKFAMEVAKAVEHYRALLQWQSDAKDARNAVTVQVHAMLNRVGLEKAAVVEHNMKAAIALISGLGQVLTAVGAHAAPVGAAMTASAKLAGAALELALQVKSAVEMQTAWNLYRKAAENPADRKTVRKALEQNATLSKYAMVWGALQDGNPLAKAVLKHCSLTDKIIADETANVEGVVKYLEILYQDDPVVLKAMPDTSEWGWPAPKPKLTLRAWNEFLAIAQSDKAKPKMKPGTGGAITGAFGTLETARAALEKTTAMRKRVEAFVESQEELTVQTTAPVTDEEPSPTRGRANATADSGESKRAGALARKLDGLKRTEEQQKEALLAALNGLSDVCTAWAPLTEANEPYGRIEEYAQALSALVEIELRKIGGDPVALSLAA